MIVDVTEAGCVGEPLRAESQGDYVHLTGQFGAFDVGDLVLAWIDQDGRDLIATELGPTTPFAAVAFDYVAKLPAGASRAELRVVPEVSGEKGVLAGVRW
jgi:hypothetical protein